MKYAILHCMRSFNEQASPRMHWLRWAETLRRYQLDGLAAWILDAGRPLAILSAQMLYIGRPFLGETVDVLAHTLESDEELRDFVSLLDGKADS